MSPRRSAFDDFCRGAFDFLQSAGLEHLVIGGLAVIAVGEPRTTADVDVIGFASMKEAEALIAKAQTAGFDVRPEVERRRLRETGTLRFRQPPFQLDVILASLPFERTALARSMEKRIFGRKVRFPTPEDLVLFKVLAGRDKDLLDAAGVVRRHAGRFDRGYVEATLRQLCDEAHDLDPWRRWEEVLHKA